MADVAGDSPRPDGKPRGRCFGSLVMDAGPDGRTGSSRAFQCGIPQHPQMFLQRGSDIYREGSRG